MKKYLVEPIGTFFLDLTVCMTVSISAELDAPRPCSAATFSKPAEMYERTNGAAGWTGVDR